MTITCASGTQVAPGAPTWFTFSETDIANYLPPVFGFVVQTAMGIPFGPQNTADFCAAPPAGDLPTTADYAKLALPPIALISGTYQRFGEQVKESKWAQLCACTGAPPPGTVCTSQRSSWNHALCSYATCSGGGNCCYAPGPFDSYPDASGRFTDFPAGQHRVTFTWHGTPTINGLVSMWSASVAEGACTFTVNSTLPNVSHTCNFGTTDTGLSIVFYNGGDPLTVDPADIELGFQPIPGVEPACGSYPPAPPPVLGPPSGFPSAPTAPTCASYQDICNALQNIDNRLQVSYAFQQMEQRRLLPFAWIAQTPATGLSGHGVLAVQDIIGVTVSLTTVPSGHGATPDTPARGIPTYGAIQATDGTFFDDWRQIHYLHEIFSIPSWATGISYSLRTGVVATLTPLNPEP